MKQRLWWLRPYYRYLVNLFALVRGFGYDFGRYLRHSALGGRPRRSIVGHVDAYVTMDYHALEKGLALKEPRAGFGMERVRNLVRLLRLRSTFGWRPSMLAALSVLREYEASQAPDDRPLAELLAATSDVETPWGGTRVVSREDVHAAARLDLHDFFAARSSVRHFSDEPVSMALIERAVVMARKTPSVCNRQAWKVYVVSDATMIAAALSGQNGNRGFGDQVDKLLIVTTDLTRFVSAGERFQPWIDGGMFAMSVVYALHSLGLGTCCLNMSTTAGQDRAFRRRVALPDAESVVMLIAVGHLPPTFRVTQSPKRDLGEVFEVLG